MFRRQIDSIVWRVLMVSYYSQRRFSNTVNVCIVFWIRCITSFNSDFVTSLLSADTSCKFFEFCEWKMVLFLVNMWYFLGEDLGIGDIIGYCIFRLNFIYTFGSCPNKTSKIWKEIHQFRKSTSSIFLHLKTNHRFRKPLQVYFWIRKWTTKILKFVTLLAFFNFFTSLF